MKVLIDIPEEVYKNIMNDHGVSPYGMIFHSIQNGTPIPDNATNVLDAIKLEIKQEYDNQGDWSYNDGLVFALEIIDKYKGDKE